MKNIILILLCLFSVGCHQPDREDRFKEVCLNGVVYYDDKYYSVPLTLAVDEDGQPIKCDQRR